MNVFELVAKLSLDTSSYTASLVEAKKKVSKVGGTLEGVGSKMVATGKKLSKVGVVTGAVLGASVKNASDFQQGMNKVNTIANVSASDLKKLGSQLLTVSTETGKSATEIAEAGYQALSASVPVDKMTEFVRTSTNLAKTGFTQTATAVDVLSTAMNAYGKKAGTAESIANKLLQTQNDGKTTVNELASSMGQVIPVASANNVSIDNLTSAYAMLTKQGINTANSTTYIKRMINELSKPSSDVAKILKEKTGKSFTELMASGKTLGDVIGILSDSVKGNTTDFQNLWKSQVSGMGALALLNGGVGEFNAEVDKMKNSGNNMSNALEKLKSPAGDLNKSLNALKNASISLGTSGLEIIAPIVSKVAKAFQNFAKWVDGLSPTLKTLVVSVLGVVTASGPMLIIVGKLVASIGQGIGVFAKMATAVKGAGGVLGILKVAFGAVISPVGLVVGAILALIAIIATLWKTNDTFRAQMTAIWGNIVALFKEFIKEVSSRMGELKGIFSNVINTIKPLWLGFCNMLAPIIVTVFGMIKNTIASTLTIILGVLDVFIGIFTGDWKKVSSGVKTIVRGLKNLIVGHFKGLFNIAKTIWKGIQNAISNPIEKAKSLVTKTVNKIRSTASSTFNALKTKVTSIWNGIKNAITKPIETAKNAVSKTISKIKGLFPLKVGKIFSNIRVPRIVVNGGKAPFGIGGQGKLPSISVKWNKIAERVPYLFKKGKAMLFGAGDANDEIMYGKKNLLKDMSTALDNVLDAQPEPTFDYEPEDIETTYVDRHSDDRVLRLLERYLPILVDSMDMKVVLNDGTLVGKLTPKIDANLGDVYRVKARRNAW